MLETLRMLTHGELAEAVNHPGITLPARVGSPGARVRSWAPTGTFETSIRPGRGVRLWSRIYSRAIVPEDAPRRAIGGAASPLPRGSAGSAKHLRLIHPEPREDSLDPAQVLPGGRRRRVAVPRAERGEDVAVLAERRPRAIG